MFLEAPARVEHGKRHVRNQPTVLHGGNRRPTSLPTTTDRTMKDLIKGCDRRWLLSSPSRDGSKARYSTLVLLRRILSKHMLHERLRLLASLSEVAAVPSTTAESTLFPSRTLGHYPNTKELRWIP